MRYILSLILVLALAAPVLAAKAATESASEPATGGFEGPVRGSAADTVAKAVKLSQDARAVLVGHIVASDADGKNLYHFKDESGEMPVQISPRHFKDLKVTPEMKVRLYGKIDKGANGQDEARLKVGKLEQVK